MHQACLSTVSQTVMDRNEGQGLLHTHWANLLAIQQCNNIATPPTIVCTEFVDYVFENRPNKSQTISMCDIECSDGHEP